MWLKPPADCQVPGVAVNVAASVSVPVTAGATVLMGLASTGPTALE